MRGIPDLRGELFSLAKRIISLIRENRFEDARRLIETERTRFPGEQAHRFTAFSALLHESLGNADDAVALMRRALQDKPDWPPHFYQLAVMLMDQERWDEAELVLGQLVSLSLAKEDAYFLTEARFRRAICLKRLGRADEFKQVKAEIPRGTSILLDDGLCRIEDL